METNKEVRKLEQKLAKKENDIKISNDIRDRKYSIYDAYNDIIDNQRLAALNMGAKAKELQFEWSEADKHAAQLQNEYREIEKELSELKLKLTKELETKIENDEN